MKVFSVYDMDNNDRIVGLFKYGLRAAQEYESYKNAGIEVIEVNEETGEDEKA